MIFGGKKEDNEEKSDRMYEVSFLVNPEISESDIEEHIDALWKSIEKAGGDIATKGLLKRIKLAYPITIRKEHTKDDYTKAYFVWGTITSSADNASVIEEILRTHEDVLRHLILVIDPEDAADPSSADEWLEVRTEAYIKKQEAEAERARESRRHRKTRPAPKKEVKKEEADQKEEVDEEKLDKEIDELVIE